MATKEEIAASQEKLAQKVAAKAFDSICYDIDYPVMEDERPPVYERVLALLTEKITERAEAFRDLD